jgi:hypothetical protein
MSGRERRPGMEQLAPYQKEGTVPEQRTHVPSWASSASMASEAQLNFIRSLIDQRDLTRLTHEQQDWLKAGDFSKASKRKASTIIDELLTLPVIAIGGTFTVPAGRYAVENAEGELRFYHVWRGKKNPNVVRLYVAHGPYESDLSNPKTMKAILDKIEAAGIRECAIRYGNEIGACSNCGRRLTNRISRELGIGPICGGRMFGDGFKDEVRAARERIVERGEDPEEEV